MKVMRNVIVLTCLLLCVVLGAVFFMYTQKEETTALVLPVGETHKVVLTQNGYEPRELTIDLGDEVVFSTERGYPHWPASNIHPTHNQYAAFDPQQSVPAEETWAFQFMQSGTWQFHDHLNSTYTGVITVREP